MGDVAPVLADPAVPGAGHDCLDVVNHVLRTPLTVVTGYLDLLLDGVLGELTEEQADALRLAENAARQLETRLTAHLSGEVLVEPPLPPAARHIASDW